MPSSLTVRTKNTWWKYLSIIGWNSTKW